MSRAARGRGLARRGAELARQTATARSWSSIYTHTHTRSRDKRRPGARLVLCIVSWAPRRNMAGSWTAWNRRPAWQPAAPCLRVPARRPRRRPTCHAHAVLLDTRRSWPGTARRVLLVQSAAGARMASVLGACGVKRRAADAQRAGARCAACAQLATESGGGARARTQRRRRAAMMLATSR